MIPTHVARINAAVCVHCGENVIESAVGEDAFRKGFLFMLEHDAKCEKHPGNVRAANIITNLTHVHGDPTVCAEDECFLCGIIVCPHNEPLHFHHDGCPMCATEVTP